MNSQEYHNARCGLPDKKDELLACPVERGVGERVGKYKCGCDIGTKWRWRNARGQITQGGRADAVTVECVGCGEEWDAN